MTLGNRRDAAAPGESPQTANDRDTWDAMYLAAERALATIADPAKCTVIGRHRDVLGSTHHEGGTLAMRTDSATPYRPPGTRPVRRVHGTAARSVRVIPMHSPSRQRVFTRSARRCPVG